MTERDWRTQRESRKARLGTLPVSAHGKVSTYTNWGCRCKKCTKANSTWHRNKYRERNQ